jgi:Mannosyltransferase (PIG-V)
LTGFRVKSSVATEVSLARRIAEPLHASDSGRELEAWRERAVFVLAMWLSSRFIVVLGIQLAPLLSLPAKPGHTAPSAGWALFAQWDARFYEQIATAGYEYIADGNYHSLAFFPLFPLMTKAVMAVGIPFSPAGVVVNSLAFLAALWHLHAWAGELYGPREANWAAAVMALFPYSLFGTVTYTEGTFLLATTAALRSFDAGRYAFAGTWGALATLTRSPGCMLVPAMLGAWLWEKRPRAAAVAGLASGAGLFAFMVFCAVRFESPLAFVDAQKGWAKDAIYWPDVIETIVRKRGVAFDSLLRAGLFVGAAVALWWSRARLSKSALLYGAFSLGLFLIVNVQSIGRFIFAVAPVSLALGLILARRPRAGFGFLGVSAVVLLAFSVRWALGYWVA